MKTFHPQRSILYGVFAVLCLLAAWLLWKNMPWGIGVHHDSFYYLNSAQNLAQGLGFRAVQGDGSLVPLNHFPPLYPGILALTRRLSGASLVSAAGFYSAAWFGLLAFAVGALIYRYTRSLIMAGLGLLAALLSPLLVDLHLVAMTEPLFLFWMILLVFFLHRYLTGQRKTDFALTVLFAVLSYFTRYIGAAAVAAGGLALLFLLPGNLAKRVRTSLVFGGLCVLPISAWLLRNIALTGSATNRDFIFHLPTANQLGAGLESLSLWLFPPTVPFRLRAALTLAAAILLTGLYIYQILRARRSPLEDLAWLDFIHAAVVFILAYLALLMFSVTFFDASTRLDNRILSPVYFLGLIIAPLLVWHTVLSGQPARVRLGILAGIGFLVAASYLPRTLASLEYMRKEGLGYTGKHWQESTAIRYLEEHPPQGDLYASDAFAVTFLTGRNAYWIPERNNPVRNEVNAGYPQAVQEMQQNILDTSGALIFFFPFDPGQPWPDIDRMTDSLVMVDRTEDGIIYSPPE